MSTEDLDALLDLQEIDTSIDQHRHRRATLPQRAALDEIERHAGEIRSTLREATAARDAVAGRQDELEAELATTENRSAEVSRRLYSGEVSASRELQAMSEELDSLKARGSGIEDRILAVLEEREPLDEQVLRNESEVARLRAEGAAAREALAAAEGEVDSEIEVLDRRREEAAGRVAGSLLGQYERLRSKLGGVAVARLVGSRCDGCHLTLPATELDRIRHLPLGEMVTCDQCGRILVVG